MDLLDLIREQEHAVDPRREWVHLVMPNMDYACGGNLVDGLPDGGPPGKWRLGGPGTDAGWAEITCPDCRAPGRRALARAIHRQQKPESHVCSDECPWTTVPE